MTAELEIPQRALGAAHEAYDAAVLSEGPGECEEFAAVRAAAPIIVAAALRAVLDDGRWPCRCDRCIRDWANELDPDGRDGGRG